MGRHGAQDQVTVQGLRGADRVRQPEPGPQRHERRLGDLVGGDVDAPIHRRVGKAGLLGGQPAREFQGVAQHHLR
jgi:hypothetical protein